MYAWLTLLVESELLDEVLFSLGSDEQKAVATYVSDIVGNGEGLAFCTIDLYYFYLGRWVVRWSVVSKPDHRVQDCWIRLGAIFGQRPLSQFSPLFS